MSGSARQRTDKTIDVFLGVIEMWRGPDHLAAVLDENRLRGERTHQGRGRGMPDRNDARMGTIGRYHLEAAAAKGSNGAQRQLPHAGVDRLPTERAQVLETRVQRVDAGVVDVAVAQRAARRLVVVTPYRGLQLICQPIADGDKTQPETCEQPLE